MKFKSYLSVQRRVKQILESTADCTSYISQMLWGHAGEVKPSQELVDEMLEKFPYGGGTIYLGTNFARKEQYEEYMVATKNGTEFHSDTMTIWVDQPKIAYVSATKHKYDGLENEKMYKAKDHMIGAAGIVLKFTVDKNKAVSPKGAGVSSSQEHKVLLPPGTYVTEIEEQHLPFVDTINDVNFKAEFMSIKSIRGIETPKKTRAKFEHILYHYKDFDDEMQRHLHNLLDATVQDIEYDVSVRMRPNYAMLKGPQIPEIAIGWNVPESFVYYFDLLDEVYSEDTINKIHAILQNIDREFREKTADVDWVEEFDLYVNPSLVVMAQLSHFENKVHFVKYLQKKIGLTYNTLNSYEETRRINRIKDENEKSDAIRAIGKRIETALNLLGKLSPSKK